jgi:hypothetical protein
MSQIQFPYSGRSWGSDTVLYQATMIENDNRLGCPFAGIINAA